jgi:hypothetical protein
MDDIRGFAASIGAELKEKKGVWTMRLVVAERKAFLSRKKLEYAAKFSINDASREVRFTELLKESGSGVSGGDDAAPGFGFKKETYRTGTGPRDGDIKQQSDYFGQQYTYDFDWSEIRTRFEQAAEDAGYTFKYSVTGAGI